MDESATTDEARLHKSMRVTYTKLVRDILGGQFKLYVIYDAMLLQLKRGKER